MDAAAEEMDAGRDELLAARAAGETQLAEDVEAEWRGRFRRRLAADPAAAEEFRSLVEELSPGATVVMGDVVNNSVSGGTMYRAVVQGRDHITIHEAAPPPAGPSDAR